MRTRKAAALFTLVLIVGLLWYMAASTAPLISANLTPDEITTGAQPQSTQRVSQDLLALSPAAEIAVPDSELQRALPPVVDGLVVIDAIAVADGQVLLAELESLGLQNGMAYRHMVSGLLPVTSIDQLAELRSLRFARAAEARLSVGSVTTQGDASMRSDEARTTFGVDGDGQTVGILSDSFACEIGTSTTYADDIASGDLPAGIPILDDYNASNCIDEGRGMAQLIHDVAPGANLAFHTAFEGQASFAQGIVDLADVGATVIVDDVGYATEPFYADGIIAQAVDEVDARGIPYFSSAGNSSDAAWDSPLGFRDSGQLVQGFPAHDFDPGTGVDVFQSFTIDPGGLVTFTFQWASPYIATDAASPGATSDLDFLVFIDGIYREDLSGTLNNLGLDPIELVSLASSSPNPIQIEIAIILRAGNAPAEMRYLLFNEGGTIDEYNTPGAATNYGHSNAEGALSVAAAAYFNTPEFGVNPPLLQSFSSFGGQAILFDVAGNAVPRDVRDNPDFTAPDGGNTTFFGNDADFDGFPNFFGTSAAAPHAAAVAALLLDLNPSLTPDEIEAALESSAIDIVAIEDGRTLPAGTDTASGAGLIQADVALASVDTATLNGVVTLEGRSPAPNPAWSVPLTVTLYEENSAAVVDSFAPTTDQNGSFSVSGIAPGAYQVAVKNSHTLQLVQVITLEPGVNSVDFGTLLEGDADDNNRVTLQDFSVLTGAFNTAQGAPAFADGADFNEDGLINLADFSLLSANFNLNGEEPND